MKRNFVIGVLLTLSLVFGSEAAAMTPEQLAKHEDSFKVFDVDSSGAISAYELMSIMKFLGKSRTDREIFDMIENSDLNSDQLIDFGEFVTMMLKGSEPDQYKQEIQRAFGSFDEDGDGFIGRAEFKEAVSNLGEVITDAEIDELLNGSDQNDDLLLDFSEFENMMLQ